MKVKKLLKVTRNFHARYIYKLLVTNEQ